MGAVYFNILDLTLVNSSIIYGEHCTADRDCTCCLNKDVKPTLVRELLTKANRMDANLGPKTAKELSPFLDSTGSHDQKKWSAEQLDTVRRLPHLHSRHYPRRSRTRKNCACHLPGKAGGRTKIFCSTCGVHLHVSPCFELWHEVPNVKELMESPSFQNIMM